MKVSLCNTAIAPMINLLRKKKSQQLTHDEIETLLNHEDYQFEFRRYDGRVNAQEFSDYLLTFESLDASQIQNMDLRNHHSYWLDLYENLDWFEDKTRNFFEKFNLDVIEDAYQIAASGFPKGYQFRDCKILFTCGIGQSFGYANENGMHFDIMQLFRHYENDNFKLMIAHELHHLIFLDNIQFNESSLEAYFLQWFAIEGLAIKFTGNAQGVLSKKLSPHKPANLGLDDASIQYLNDHFDAAYSEFQKNLEDIRRGTIKTVEDVQKLLLDYWFNLYADGQRKEDIPQLKQSRLYTMGNDLWGTLYDVYGMDELYKILNHTETFSEKFNQALRILGKTEYLIS